MPNLFIAVDATGIVPGTAAGVENFTYRLVRAMAAVAVDERFVVLVPHGTRARWSSQLGAHANVVLHETLVPATLRNVTASTGDGSRALLARTVWRMRSSARLRRIAARLKAARRQRLLRKLRPDVVYLPTHLGGCPDWPAVVTVHDVRGLSSEFPDAANAAQLASAVARAGAVVTAWEHPLSDLLRHFPEVAPKLWLVPFPPMLDVREVPPTSRSMPYLLYPSGTAPHKNHERLVRALAAVRPRRQVELVCTGPKIEPTFTRLEVLVQELGLEDAVTFTGFVSEEELAALYRGSAAVIAPSQWEAASGPIMEALAYGKPVACSLIPPIEQQVMRAQATVSFFDPTDVGSISRSIGDVLDHPERYSAQRASHGEVPSWEDVGRKYLNILRTVAERAGG